MYALIIVVGAPLIMVVFGLILNAIFPNLSEYIKEVTKEKTYIERKYHNEDQWHKERRMEMEAEQQRRDKIQKDYEKYEHKQKYGN